MRPRPFGPEQAAEAAVEQVLRLVEQKERRRAGRQKALRETHLGKTLAPPGLVALLVGFGDGEQRHADMGGKRAAELGLAGAGRAVEQDMGPWTAKPDGSGEELRGMGRARPEMREVRHAEARGKRRAEQPCRLGTRRGRGDVERVAEPAPEPLEHPERPVRLDRHEARRPQRRARGKAPLHNRGRQAEQESDQRRVRGEPHLAAHGVGQDVEQPLDGAVDAIAQNEAKDRRLMRIKPGGGGKEGEARLERRSRVAQESAEAAAEPVGDAPDQGSVGIPVFAAEQVALAAARAASAHAETERILEGRHPGEERGGAAGLARKIRERCPSIADDHPLFACVHDRLLPSGRP